MTNAEIIAEFERLWQMQKRRPQGPDAEDIANIIAAKSDKTISQVKAIILDNTFTPPN
jgi:hypothetical protein